LTGRKAEARLRGYAARLKRKLAGTPPAPIQPPVNRPAAPPVDPWIHSHVVEAPGRAAAFCGDMMRGAKILNVGCGEMLMDFGLLNYGPASIMGLDVDDHPDWSLERLAAKISAQGLHFPGDYARRLAYTCYGGTEIPFDDGAFDFIFSWSAFEHIPDMDAVLREMYRVLRPRGHAFVQVSPWHDSLMGSHLTDYIKQPFFHLTQDDDWVEARLREAAELHPPEHRDFITKYLFGAYRTLNRKSCDDFYTAARAAGFVIRKAKIGAREEDLSQAPAGVAFHDLMIDETMMLMRKD